ncbi:hypothetical protein AXG93_2374s1130 [Marchantia polymorpha subsp. ruderalis]|uniref:Uncharacterized protein n=1 Tax=Marchantia polymorpha subsp. ruderalis TaxID=1480154 RepID=A0A176WHL0_MARPO|nr:hypothetical protein AXG93_2374s1130 [Marchantia polymorpha subsp. ruderalis]
MTNELRTWLVPNEHYYCQQHLRLGGRSKAASYGWNQQQRNLMPMGIGTGVLRREKIDHGWMASGVEDVGTTYREARASSLRKADGVAVAVVAVGWAQAPGGIYQVPQPVAEDLRQAFKAERGVRHGSLSICPDG